MGGEVVGKSLADRSWLFWAEAELLTSESPSEPVTWLEVPSSSRGLSRRSPGKWMSLIGTCSNLGLGASAWVEVAEETSFCGAFGYVSRLVEGLSGVLQFLPVSLVVERAEQVLVGWLVVVEVEHLSEAG